MVEITPKIQQTVMLVNSPINLMVVWDMNSLNIGSRYVLAVMKIIKVYFLV